MTWLDSLTFAGFSALLGFPTLTGVGAQTTYGFGEVSPELLDRPSRTRHPTPMSIPEP